MATYATINLAIETEEGAGRRYAVTTMNQYIKYPKKKAGMRTESCI